MKNMNIINSFLRSLLSLIEDATNSFAMSLLFELTNTLCMNLLHGVTNTLGMSLVMVLLLMVITPNSSLGWNDGNCPDGTHECILPDGTATCDCPVPF